MVGISRQVKYQRKHKELGLCQLCPEKAVLNRTRCAEHLQKHAIEATLWRDKAKLKEAGNGKDTG